MIDNVRPSPQAWLVWTSYSPRQAAQLLGLTESTVRLCVKEGLIGHAHEVPARLHFRDLAVLRLLRHLTDQGVPLAQARRDMLAIAKHLPPAQAITEVPLEARLGRIVVRGQGPTYGQLALPMFEPATTPEGVLAPLERPLAEPAAEPRHGEAWLAQAQALEDHDPVAAIAAYRKGLALLPEAADGWINLGRLLAENDDALGAVACFQTAQTLDPDDATIHYNLGVVAQDEGNTPQAVTLYLHALALDPALAEAHYNLATIYDQTGDTRAAIRHINEYRKLTKSR